MKTGTLSIRKTDKPAAVKTGKTATAKSNTTAQKNTKQKTSKRRTSASSEAFASERRSMIAEEAYYNAEKRGFQSGHEELDWLEAEKTVDRLLGSAANSASH